MHQPAAPRYGAQREHGVCSSLPLELEGEPDEEVWAAAHAADRVLVTENVHDFRCIETAALARAQPVARLIFTTDRQFPLGDPATIGRLVTALDGPLIAEPELATSLFLKPTPSP